jgi:alcohol dehydrogenase class IV
MIDPFSFATTPQLHFGVGKISSLFASIKIHGDRPLLITGAHSFISSPVGITVMEKLSASRELLHYVVTKEPDPGVVDNAVRKFAGDPPDIVVAIGGGSVLDAGKAISAMLKVNEPVKNYLEGVGTKSSHPGIKIPFIAVPTTSGTGSEATKNAVLSETGENGYKRSLRHDNFVPEVAIVDPSLTVHCPPSITASSGMDAFTQLLESYLSTKANPLTDALALEGLKKIHRSLLQAFRDGSNIQARTDMALASYISGVTLANAGLGLVHGFASSVGGLYDIAHGIICSSLMAASNGVTVRKLRATGSNPHALKKYAAVGRMFVAATGHDDAYYTDALLELLWQWKSAMKIPDLLNAGVPSSAFRKIADATDNKNNPVPLDKAEMMEVLETSGVKING